MGDSAPLVSIFHTSSYVVSKSLLRVWCCAGSNSHKVKSRCWHGRIRRTSITWIILTCRIGLFTRDWMQVCNPVTSSSFPHDRPVSFQDMSRVGGPDLNSGAATHFGSRGLVM